MTRIVRNGLACAALCLASLLTACGPKGSAPPQCQSTELLCNGACVNITNNNSNCGGCGLACADPAGGTATCTLGVCVPSCAAPSALCGARAGGDGGAASLSCTNTNIDPVNCGACGTVCAAQQTCTNGQCTNCPAGQLQCAGTTAGQTQCKAVLSDNQNCGGCGIVCGSGSRCDNGACAALGLSNCGNSDGGVATQIDLQNDHNNCGTCGNACTAGEACQGGLCNPCDFLQCGNHCVDPSRDRNNCGACGTICTGNALCVNSACQTGVTVTLLTPTSSGKVPALSSFPQQVRVDSALPIREVFADVTTAGVDGGVHTTLSPFSPSGPFINSGGSTLWQGNIPLLDGGVNFTGTVTVTAHDVAFRPDAGDAPLHQDSKTAAGVTSLLAPTQQPVFSVTAIDGGTIPNGAFIPLNADPITLKATNLGAAASVDFVNTNFSSSVSYPNLTGYGLLANVAVDGGVAQITLQPGELGTDLAGVTRLSACPVDITGQSSAASGCSDGGVSTGSFTGTVGRMLRSPSYNPLLLAASDGGSPVILYSPDAGVTTPIAAIPATQIQPSLPLTGVGAASYFTDTLQVAETSTSAIAVRADGTGIDRFDCASGTCTVRTPYVTGTGLRFIRAFTGKVIVATDIAGGNTFFAFPPATGSTAFAAAVINGNANGFGYQTTASGAVVFIGSDISGPTANQQQLRIIHPLITGGVAGVGPKFPAGGARALKVFRSGEIAWQYNDGTVAAASASTPAGKFQLAGTYYDGTATQPTPTALYETGSQAPDSWLLARPQVIIVNAYDAGIVTTGPALPPTGIATYANRAQAVELNLKAGTVAALNGKLPVPPFSNAIGPPAAGTGALSGMIRDRANNTGNFFAVSDDQTKVLFATADPSGQTATPTTYTLWLGDLATSTAQAVYSSPLLAGDNNRYFATSEGAAHFVHSAPGSLLLNGNVPPAGTPTALGAIVFGETLTPGSGTGSATQYTRLFYALYHPDTAAAPNPVAIEPTAVSYNNLSNQLQAASATAGVLMFLSDSSAGVPSAYSVPLTQQTAGTVTASLLLENAYGLQVREDKGRFLIARNDGVLFAGKLSASAAPGTTLTPVLDGLTGGPGPVSQTDALNAFGLTPDGNHAWAITHLAPSPNSGGCGLLDDPGTVNGSGCLRGPTGSPLLTIATYRADLESVDLAAPTATRTNWGAATFFPDATVDTLRPAPCFFGNAQFAINQSHPGAEHYEALTAYFEAASTLPKRTALLPTAFASSGSPAICGVSADGSEVFVKANNFGAVTVSAQSGGTVTALKDFWFFQDILDTIERGNSPFITGDPSIQTAFTYQTVRQNLGTNYYGFAYKLMGPQSATSTAVVPPFVLATDNNTTHSSLTRYQTDNGGALVLGVLDNSDGTGLALAVVPYVGKPLATKGLLP